MCGQTRRNEVLFNASPRMRVVDFEISVSNEKSHGTVTVKGNQQSHFQSTEERGILRCGKNIKSIDW